MMKFEVYDADGLGTVLAGGEGRWGWRLLACNGRVVAAGDNYADREDCLRAVELMMAVTVCTPVIDTLTGHHLTYTDFGWH